MQSKGLWIVFIAILLLVLAIALIARSSPAPIPFQDTRALSLTATSSSTRTYTLQSNGGRTQVRNDAGGLELELDQYRYYRAYVLYDGRLRFLYQNRLSRNATAIAWENPHRYGFSLSSPAGTINGPIGYEAIHVTDYLDVPWGSTGQTLTLTLTLPSTALDTALLAPSGALDCAQAPILDEQVFYTIDWDGIARLYNVLDCEVQAWGHWQHVLLRFINNVIAPSQVGDVTEDRASFGEWTELKWDFTALPLGGALATPVYQWQLLSDNFGAQVVLPTYEDRSQWTTRLSTDLNVVPWSDGRNYYHLYVRPV